MLDRTSANLQLVVLAFLKKLSIFQENMDAMIRLHVPEKLVTHLNCSHEKTIQVGCLSTGFSHLILCVL